MSLGQAHIIRRQNIKVNATVQDSFALKQKIERFAEDMATKLSSLLDGLVSKNEWLQIDKLDIEVDDLREEDLDEKLTERVLLSIRDKIDERNYQASVIDANNPYGTNPAHTKGKPEDAYPVLPVHQKTIGAFSYFLRHGILPWWFETTSPGLFEEALLAALELCLNGKEEENRRIILDIHAALSSSSAQKRLAEQFQQQIYLKVVRLVSQKLAGDSFSEINKVSKAIGTILTSKAEVNPVGLNQTTGQHLAIIKQVLNDSRVSLLAGLVNSHHTYELINKWLLKVYQSLNRYSLQHLQKVFLENTALKRYLTEDFIPFLSEPVPINPIAKPGESNKEDSGMVLKSKSHKSIEELAKEDGLLISNAGLVIVSPFLPHLFEHCGIIEEHKIINPAKAMALTHYAVYGNCEYREYDILLNKILCGLDANEPVALLQELSGQEISQVENMLTALISHWSVLGSTSPDGLREGFLLRKGILTHKHGEWFLQVEQKTPDVLLDQLPWTIGFIKLPWMKAMLKTQWR